MEEKDFNFNFGGFPDNSPIEVPDKKEKKPEIPTGASIARISGNPEELIEALGMLSSNLNNSGFDTYSFLEQLGLTNGLPEHIKEVIKSTNIPEPEDKLDPADYWKLSDMGFFIYQDFGNITCQSLTTNDVQELLKAFDPSSNNVSIIINNTFSELVPYSEVNHLELVVKEEYFALFKAIPKDPKKHYFYMAGVRDEYGNLKLFVPSYPNTLYIAGDNEKIETVALFDRVRDAEFLSMDPFNTMIGNVIGALMFSIMTMICPVQRTILSPHLFGEIRNTRASVSSNANYLRIGTIVSNESADSILLKKDAGFDLDQKEFPFYFKFNEVKDKETLILLSEMLSKKNFNACELMKNSELKYSSDGLYIDVDFGNF